MDELSFGRYGWTCTLAVLSPEAGAARDDDGMALVTGCLGAAALGAAPDGVGFGAAALGAAPDDVGKGRRSGPYETGSPNVSGNLGPDDITCDGIGYG